MTEDTPAPVGLPRRVVTATVVGHVMHNGKPATQLEIPEWKSQYPTTLYGTTPEQQALLPMGAELRIVLKADNQRPHTDGTKPWNFWWSFVGLAEPEKVFEPEGIKPIVLPVDGVRDTGRQIHRSVALQQAVAFYADERVMPDEVCKTAEVFFGWLIGGVLEATRGPQEDVSGASEAAW